MPPDPERGSWLSVGLLRSISAGSANSAKSAHLSNKWMPELESPCDCGSKTLFSKRSFAPEHRFAFDSRVPASSCVQYSRTAKLLVIAQVRCSRANEHVEKSRLGRKCYRDSNFANCKVASNRVRSLLQLLEHVRRGFLGRNSPKDSISGIHLLLRCAEHVRFVSVGSKLQQVSWKSRCSPI